MNELYDHFKNLYSTETNSRSADINYNIYDDDLDKEIEMQEIRKAVFSQNDNKSSGIDSLVAEMYKCSFDEISTTLHLLFNKIYVSGEYPISWGKA
jgi:hypothetical protein